jgi:valyl-tRNA synthetase
VSRTDPDKCAKCGSKNIEQDPDVLDTWFSSQLWPFSTLGWPDRTPILKQFYPNSVLVTAYDILFFWVARMMMAGIHFMKDVPFYDIFLHGLVRDERGDKFSKTKGNAIDPLELIDEFGADALRLALIFLASMGRDLKLSVKRIEDSKHFINKVWNASKFALIQLEGFDPAQKAPVELSLADRWIKSRLQAAAAETKKLIEAYQFGEAAQAVYHFFWDEFCDWYIEWSKPYFYRAEKPEQKTATQQTIREVLDQALRLLHPFMPFLTEEIWQAMPGHGESIMVAPFPKPDASLTDSAAEAAVADLQEAVSAIRILRSENMAPIAAKVKVLVLADDRETAKFFATHKQYLESPPQVNIKELEIKLGKDKPSSFVAHRVRKAEVCVDLAGLIDFDKEEGRLRKEEENRQGTPAH